MKSINIELFIDGTAALIKGMANIRVVSAVSKLAAPLIITLGEHIF